MKCSSDNRSFASRRIRSAFTIIELIVVIGIIVLVASLLLSTLGKANKTAQRTRQSADLQSISQALEAYRADMHDYPRVSPGMQTGDPNYVSGAELLCWALLAPGSAQQDGAGPDGQPATTPGMGFRTRGTTGQVYGPYLTPSKFRLVNMKTLTLGSTDDPASAIADYWDNPIYYCPATPNVDPTIAPPQGGGYVNTYSGNGPRPMYDVGYFKEADRFSPPQFQDQDSGVKGSNYIMSLTEMQEMLGDLNHNAIYDSVVPDPKHPESQQNLPFLLWSAGPNGQFGFDPPHPHASKVPYTSDDVANFDIQFPKPPP